MVVIFGAWFFFSKIWWGEVGRRGLHDPSMVEHAGDWFVEPISFRCSLFMWDEISYPVMWELYNEPWKYPAVFFSQMIRWSGFPAFRKFRQPPLFVGVHECKLTREFMKSTLYKPIFPSFIGWRASFFFHRSSWWVAGEWFSGLKITAGTDVNADVPRRRAGQCLSLWSHFGFFQPNN